MEPFEKIVRIGHRQEGNNRNVHIFIRVEYDSKGELHITGCEGPRNNGNAWGSCGQIVMGYDTEESRREVVLAGGWTNQMVDRLFDVWRKYHLNHMCAGSPAQTATLVAANYDRHKDGDHWTWAQKVLEDAGLNPDPSYLYLGEPYRYGHGWLKIDVPDEVLVWLRDEIPETDREPAWV